MEVSIFCLQQLFYIREFHLFSSKMTAYGKQALKKLTEDDFMGIALNFQSKNEALQQGST